MTRQREYVEGDVEHLVKMVDHKDDVDASNNVLKEDLERIKMANLSLQDKVKDGELENANLSSKLTHAQVGR